MRATVEAVGVSFNIERSGKGPAVVFVHGLEGDLHGWDRLWTDLGDHYDKIRYDLRGCGRSSDPPGVTFDHAEDLAALLDTLGVERCSLIGVSKGAAVALNFTLDRPGRVEKLVLISPAIVAWDWSNEWRDLWKPMVQSARAGRLDEARELWWRHPLFDSVRDGPAAVEVHQGILRCSGAEWLEGDREKHKLPDVDRLPMLAVPTLLLSGELDMPDFRLVADLIAGISEKVRRSDVPDAGHMLMVEQPGLCASEIRRFLG